MAKKIIQLSSNISFNREVSTGYFKAVLECPQIASKALPGQFVQVRVCPSLDPLLRRPLSIHRVGLKQSSIEILYQVIGKATGILSQKKPGDSLDIIGPLGKGFDYPKQPRSAGNREHLLIAGGMGTAPLVFLAEKLKEGRSKTIVLIGAKTKSQLLCEEEFKKLDCEVKISTDDGSKGFKGRVTELLKKELSSVGCQLSAIYGCGPKPMLKELSRISQEYKIRAQISLEAHMACGIGACLGCVIETTVGFMRVCKEGPVFDADKINWR